MTLYTSEELLAGAAAMRREAEMPGLSDAVRQSIRHMAEQMNGAATGHVPQETLQAAVDACNLAVTGEMSRLSRMNDAGQQVDAAIDADDPAAWRDAMLAFLPTLPEDYLRVLMDAFDTFLVREAIGLAQELDAMEIGGCA